MILRNMAISALIVEDDRDARELVYSYVKDIFTNTYKISHAEKALDIIKSDETIQLILLDWNLPGISGIDFVKFLRGSSDNRYIYIIMITGEQSKESIITAYENGVDDYITKPFSYKELKAKLKSAFRIINMENSLREKYITVYQKSIYDSLTEIYNRTETLERLSHEFMKHKRSKNIFGITLFDIDHFKKINDTYGHQCGDFILKNVSLIIKSNIRSYDILGRYGGEEFLLIAPDTNLDSLVVLSNRIKDLIEKKKFLYNNKIIRVTISGGISTSDEADTIEDLIKIADIRLYQSKNQGRNKITY